MAKNILMFWIWIQSIKNCTSGTFLFSHNISIFHDIHPHQNIPNKKKLGKVNSCCISVPDKTDFRTLPVSVLGGSLQWTFTQPRCPEAKGVEWFCLCLLTGVRDGHSDTVRTQRDPLMGMKTKHASQV